MYSTFRTAIRLSVCMLLIQGVAQTTFRCEAHAAVQRMGLDRKARTDRDAATDIPTDLARRVAKEIAQEAILPPNGPDGKPLPLASHWNVGTVRRTFVPDHQILVSKQFRNGPEEYWAGVIRPDGKKVRQLSPFGNLDVWRTPASIYVGTEAMSSSAASWVGAG